MHVPVDEHTAGQALDGPRLVADDEVGAPAARRTPRVKAARAGSCLAREPVPESPNQRGSLKPAMRTPCTVTSV